MSKLKVTTIANVADSESTDVTNVINGSAKAWVNFNGTGTVAIRRAFNVSSITDNSTGNYTVNFTTAMADANYAAVCSAHYQDSVSLYIGLTSTRLLSTGSLRFVAGPESTATGQWVASDYSTLCVAIFSN